MSDVNATASGDESVQSPSTTFDRYICRFDSNLQLVNKVEAPKFIRDKVCIIKETVVELIVGIILHDQESCLGGYRLSDVLHGTDKMPLSRGEHA